MSEDMAGATAGVAVLARALNEWACEVAVGARRPVRDEPGPAPLLAAARRRARSRSYQRELQGSPGRTIPSDAAQALDQAEAARRAVHVAQAEELVAAVAWGEAHLTTDAEQVALAHEQPRNGREQLEALAGTGAPWVAEFCVAELGLALGVSTDAARTLLGDGLELKHRLPRCWDRLLAGGVPVYRARRVATATRDLSPEAASYVDAEVVVALPALGVKALDGVVEAAKWRFHLAEVLAEQAAAGDRRDVRIELEHRDRDGNVSVESVLDAADALELERVVADLAHQLLVAGSTDPLHVRRAHAMGMLARGEAPLALRDEVIGRGPEPQAEEWDATPPAEPPTVRRRQVVLHVHISDAALHGSPGLARVEQVPGHGLVTSEQVRAWCAAPATVTEVVVRPVIDLNAQLTTGSYEVPTRITEQVALRDRTCVFPHCTRDARRCDCDHVTPYRECGHTDSDDVAALCRRHHRLKTHHPGWNYRVLHPGTYLWSSPGGRQVLRDPAGTHAVAGSS